MSDNLPNYPEIWGSISHFDAKSLSQKSRINAPAPDLPLSSGHYCNRDCLRSVSLNHCMEQGTTPLPSMQMNRNSINHMCDRVFSASPEPRTERQHLGCQEQVTQADHVTGFPRWPQISSLASLSIMTSWICKQLACTRAQLSLVSLYRFAFGCFWSADSLRILQIHWG